MPELTDKEKLAKVPVLEPTKKIVIKHVPTMARVYEIAEEEKKKGNLIKGITARSNVLELKDKIIHFVVWYELEKVWNHINGCFGAGEIDFEEIDKAFDMMKKMAHVRKELHEKVYSESNINEHK